MHRKPIIILLVILIASLILTSIPIAYCGYSGLDNRDDVPDINIDTGNAMADSFLNSFLGIFTSLAEVLFDALFKAPFNALYGAWQSVYNALIGWGLVAPVAWILSTFLFVMGFTLGLIAIAMLLDWLL